MSPKPSPQVFHRSPLAAFLPESGNVCSSKLSDSESDSRSESGFDSTRRQPRVGPRGARGRKHTSISPHLLQQSLHVLHTETQDDPRLFDSLQSLVELARIWGLLLSGRLRHTDESARRSAVRHFHSLESESL